MVLQIPFILLADTSLQRLRNENVLRVMTHMVPQGSKYLFLLRFVDFFLVNQVTGSDPTLDIWLINEKRVFTHVVDDAKR